ncbi:MAG: hypothetical protein AVDCRST_MAG16-2268 [uncultured Frankineae bacterium]|uniref:Uncharacterized protein n=1 Tax=uncultured Frankineae bacterium TaxID=437475 RepID=A0A6J4M4V6_9ACTN|nr:MAG: hypothetical protein AVDCRST_MAG16-2268 [uncultured Frankineae bacterium]
MSETPDAIPMQTVEAPTPEPAPEAKPARKSPGRRTGGRASGNGRRSSGPRAPRTPARVEAPAAASDGGSLAAALRGLLSGIDEEVAGITALSEEIDEHVRALNELRSQATERLLHLDELRAAADDVNLTAFLDTSISPQLPQIEEEFPDRIYGG